MKNEKRKIRRLNLLCGETSLDDPYKYKSNKVFTIDEYIEFNKKIIGGNINPHSFHVRRAELLNLFKELNFSDDEYLIYWWNLWKERWVTSKIYAGKPTPIKKDNFNSYGEEVKLYGTRRYPRKCRKTAWKRFYKLFPNLK